MVSTNHEILRSLHNTRWVCEAHPDRPWEGPRACTCGGAGDPCPVCNPCDADNPPAMHPDFVADPAPDEED